MIYIQGIWLSALVAMCQVEIISLVTIHTALDIRERYSFSWYDSLIVAAALEAGCDTLDTLDTLYSEDMQNSQVINGRLRIVNPFV
jgi:predicted nucleic acid-binding protein